MIDVSGSTQVYLATGVTDLRKSFNGLAVIVKLKFKLDPYSKSMFVFCNRNRNLVKVLQWDGSGMCLFIKRLDKGKFQWPMNASEVKLVSPKSLRWLLEGLSIEQKGAFKESHPTVVV